MRVFKLSLLFVFFIALVAAAIVFIRQNSDPMTVQFLNHYAESYKWLILLFAVLAGAVLSAVFFIFELIVLESRNVRLRRINSKLERALNVQRAALESDTSKSSAVADTAQPSSSTHGEPIIRSAAKSSNDEQDSY